MDSGPAVRTGFANQLIYRRNFLRPVPPSDVVKRITIACIKVSLQLPRPNKWIWFGSRSVLCFPVVITDSENTDVAKRT